MKRLVDSGALVTSFPCRPSTMALRRRLLSQLVPGTPPSPAGCFCKKHPRHRLYYLHILGASRLGGRPHLQNVFQRQHLRGCIARTALNTAPARKAALLWNTAARKSPLASCAALPGTPETKMGRGAVHLRRRHAHFIPSDISCKKRRRAARAFIGTRASAEFDFYTAQLRVDYYDERHTAVHQFHYPEGLVHFGGDEALARGFAEMLEGAPSPLGLEHGLASAAACLAARARADPPGGNHRIRLLSGAFPQRKQEQSRRSAPLHTK